MPDWTPEFLVYGFISYVVFLFSTTCHEACARAGGQARRRQHRRVGGTGDAESGAAHTARAVGHGGVPIQCVPAGARQHDRMGQRAVRSGVGAATSETGGADGPGGPGGELHADADRGGGAAHRRHAAGWLHSDAIGRPDFATVTLLSCFPLNLLLGTFNLLPVPPLDGSTVIMLLMSEKQRATLSGLAAREQLREARTAGGIAGVPVFLRTDREFRDESAAPLEIPNQERASSPPLRTAICT